jgi:hypothetical protein
MSDTNHHPASCGTRAHTVAGPAAGAVLLIYVAAMIGQAFGLYTL